MRLSGTVISIGTLNPGQTGAYDPGYSLRRRVTVDPAMRYFEHYLDESMRSLSETAGRYPHVELLDADYLLADVARVLRLRCAHGHRCIAGSGMSLTGW